MPTDPIQRTRNSWTNMRQRCNNPKANGYANYGGRGITVCERWAVFANFLADMGERPDGLWLDRIDPDGNYEPGNCRWVLPADQGKNRRQRDPAELHQPRPTQRRGHAAHEESDQLRAIRHLREQRDQEYRDRNRELAELIDKARAEDHTWPAIAAAMGLTRQALRLFRNRHRS